MKKNRTHPFTSWLEGQAHRDDPVGDLARDVCTDETWPKMPGTIDLFRRHLITKGSSPEARQTLGLAWTEFLLGSI